MMQKDQPELLGCDFTSSPTARKQIVLAWGRLKDGEVQLDRLERLPTLDAFAAMLARPLHWMGAFDLPFGLPRELLESLGWPLQWEASIRHMAALERRQLREQFAAFCDARPVGAKFAHRACDAFAGSSPSMKWVNPPVAYMLHAGVPLLLDAGVHIPGLHDGDRRRVALEGYPGMLAREVLDGWGPGRKAAGRRSYKSDDVAKQTPQRLEARQDLVQALERGGGVYGRLRSGLRLRLTPALREIVVNDATGDALDAVLCMLQAGWAWQQHVDGADKYGLPVAFDALEGWIVTA